MKSYQLLQYGEVRGQELLSLHDVSDSNKNNQTQWPNSIHCTAFKMNIGKKLSKAKRELVRQVQLHVGNIASFFATIVDKLTNVQRIDRAVG